MACLGKNRRLRLHRIARPQVLNCLAFSVMMLVTSERSSMKAADVPPPTGPAVRELIEQLGAESYATRMRAKETLQRIGLEAFDQLQDAQFHPDNEIALTARYLITSLSVSWSKESDPPEVREKLQEYGGLGEKERQRRIDQLAEVANRAGAPALVRIANYERSLRLSRHAAMAIMKQTPSEVVGMRLRTGEKILQALITTDRLASDWLLAYGTDLTTNTYGAQKWRDLIKVQREKIQKELVHTSTEPSMLELVRVCATRASKHGLTDEAISLASLHSDLIPPTTRGLIDACSWAIDQQLHQFVLELQRQHRRMFSEHPMLLYGAAEAHQIAGATETGQELAKLALQMNPLPNQVAGESQMQPRAVEESARAHREIANQLAERGRFDWAEGELRLIIDSLDIASNPAAIARADLAVLLGDLERHRDVANLLQPLVDRIEKDDKLKQQLIRLTSFNYSYMVSSAQYHSGLALINEGDVDQARPLLAQAFQRYPVNVDILISMHRLDGDETWRSLVDRTLDVTVRQVEQSIQDVRDDAKRFGQPITQELGYQLNQYAWLVANTRGNQEKALNYSLESLNISNDGAKMDTCARCYFATGDFDNAMRMQKLALKQMPYSPPLLRQLKLIEDAKKKASLPSNQPVVD